MLTILTRLNCVESLKKSFLMLLLRFDFHTMVSLLSAPNAYAMRIFTSFSAKEMSVSRYVNVSTSFKVSPSVVCISPVNKYFHPSIIWQKNTPLFSFGFSSWCYLQRFVWLGYPEISIWFVPVKVKVKVKVKVPLMVLEVRATIFHKYLRL